MENGKADIDMVYLTLIAHVLKKPLRYFSPEQLRLNSSDVLSPLEQELLVIIRKLDGSDQKKIIAEVKTLVNYQEYTITIIG
jgi:hypothetical protein